MTPLPRPSYSASEIRMMQAHVDDRLELLGEQLADPEWKPNNLGSTVGQSKVPPPSLDSATTSLPHQSDLCQGTQHCDSPSQTSGPAVMPSAPSGPGTTPASSPSREPLP